MACAMVAPAKKLAQAPMRAGVTLRATKIRADANFKRFWFNVRHSEVVPQIAAAGLFGVPVGFYARPIAMMADNAD